MKKASARKKRSAPPRRAPWERIVAWCGIGVLLLVLVVELMSRRGFDATQKELEALIFAPAAPGQTTGASTDDVGRHVHGFVFRGTETRGDKKYITLRWPSLFKSYRLSISLDSSDRATLVAVGPPQDSDSPPTQSASAPKQQVAAPTPTRKSIAAGTLPKQGMSAAAQTVSLQLNDVHGRENTWDIDAGSLMRELFRQSFLISARDELGLPTRDAALGESMTTSEAGDVFPFELKIDLTAPTGQNDFTLDGEIVRPLPGSNWDAWTLNPLTIPRQNSLESAAEQLEALSRRDLVKILNDAGYQKAAATQSAAAPASLDAPMDFVSQFGLIRVIHGRMRSAGETDDMLAGLVRAYANLGSLVDHHWSPAAKVFKARSLIYAQRLLARQGVTPFALAHRAYARGLAGRHMTAIDDVKAARAAAGIAAPVWLPLIEAYCAYTPSTFKSAGGQYEQLAAYLRMRLTDLEGNEAEAIKVCQRFLEMNDSSCRAAEFLCEMKALGVRRSVTEVGFTAMWPGIYSRLALVPELPASAKSVADLFRRESGRPANVDPAEEFPARIKLIEGLDQAAAGDRSANGLSWSALAELLRDATFVQAWRKLRVEAESLAIDPVPSRDALLPLVKGHRYEHFIHSFTTEPKEREHWLGEQLNGINLTWLEAPAMPLALRIHNSSEKKSYSTLRFPMDMHADRIFEDLIRLRNRGSLEDDVSQSYMQVVSPYHPFSIAWMIEQNWEQAEPQASEWQRKYGDSPRVMMALALKYDALQQYEDEEKCLNEQLKLSPTFGAYRQLANLYGRYGDRERCRQTLEESLSQPDFGLEEASVREQIAGILMREGKWTEAQAYANGAAESYASWGLTCAARCAEQLKQWSVAEAFQRANSERYDTSADDWYFWCYRTKQGNLAAARTLANKAWQQMTPPYSGAQTWSLGSKLLLDGNRPQAMVVFTFDVEKQQNSYALVMGALLYDEFDRIPERDETFDLVAKGWTKWWAAAELVNRFRRALNAEGGFRWNRQSFEELVLQAPENDVTFLYLLAGMFLNKHGQNQLAREYLECAATSFDVESPACLLATQRARDLKINLKGTRAQEIPDSLVEINTLLDRADAATARKELDEALRSLDEAVAKAPEMTQPLIARAQCYQRRGEPEKAIADLNAILKLNPESDSAHSGLAWIYSTCEQDNIRNGSLAVEHAQKSIALRSFKTPRQLSILAAAFAEQGDFRKAEANEKTAIRMWPLQRRSWKRYNLYHSNQPYREKMKMASK